MYYNREWKTMIKVRETRVWTLYRSTNKYIRDYWSWYYHIRVPVYLSTIQESLPPFISKKKNVIHSEKAPRKKKNKAALRKRRKTVV